MPGDLITLHAGDIVPADCVLISARALSSDESLLTGESVPVHKRVGDRAYSGCPVGTGSAFGHRDEKRASAPRWDA